SPPQAARARTARGRAWRTNLILDLHKNRRIYISLDSRRARAHSSTGRRAEYLAGASRYGMVRSMRSIWLLAVLLLAALPRPARSDAGESAYREAREALLKLIDDEKAKRYRDRWE